MILKSAKETPWGAIGNGLLGAFVSGEANAYAAKDHTPFLNENKDGSLNFIPAIIPGILDPKTRTRYALAGALGAGLLNTQKIKPIHGIGWTSAESYVAGTLGNISEYYAAATDKLKNPDKYKSSTDGQSGQVTINTDETTSDKVFNYGSVLLGLAGLGLGGYALYKSLTGNKAKAKVKLRGKADDPYDDVEVEMPMDQLNVSNTMGKRVNTSVRKTIRDSNKFNSRKKDKETGKLISYEEYVGKYGEDDKTKKNVLQPLEKQSSYIPAQNISEKDLERMQKEYEKELERMQKKHERDLKYKGIGMGVGSVLGGVGGYMFGSQAFNGSYPTSYSPGVVNTLGGVGGLLGGGLLGGYLADKFSEY